MLAGNIAAFGGTMINAEFRRQWWPLACTHVAMNLGLLVMELTVTPQRRGVRYIAIGPRRYPVSRHSVRAGCSFAAVGAAIAAVMASRDTFGTNVLWNAVVGGCISVYAYALYCCYSTPTSAPDQHREIQVEDPQ